MILRVDWIGTALPPPSDPDPAGAMAIQELMGGRFGEMSTLTLNGLGWRGSILAPSAALAFANGNINGQVMVDTLFTDWGGEYHNFAFTGDLPVGDAEDPSPTPVPEPSDLALLGVVSLLLAWRFKRRAA